MKYLGCDCLFPYLMIHKEGAKARPRSPRGARRASLLCGMSGPSQPCLASAFLFTTKQWYSLSTTSWMGGGRVRFSLCFEWRSFPSETGSNVLQKSFATRSGPQPSKHRFCVSLQVAPFVPRNFYKPHFSRIILNFPICNIFRVFVLFLFHPFAYYKISTIF